MSARSEARLKRLVKKKRGKVLRDIATEFNIRNGDHSVSERTVQRYLHKKRIYRRIVKKRMVHVSPIILANAICDSSLNIICLQFSFTVHLLFCKHHVNRFFLLISFTTDKKEVIVNLKSNGHKISEISRMLSIPESTCRSVIKTYNERKTI
jgi:transposase